jgi:hypothetical protein
MKGRLLTLSILLSAALVFWIQSFDFTMGYLLGIVSIGLHVLAVSLYFTTDDEL